MMAQTRRDGQSVPAYLVTGPSGAGKSHLLHSLRARGTSSTFDLDLLGYRSNPGRWQEWLIPPETVGFLLDYVAPHHEIFVMAGCSSNGDEIINAAQVRGVTVIMIVPPVDLLRRNRRSRGDSPDKVNASESDIESWTVRASKVGATVVTSPDDAMALIDSRFS